MRKKKSLMESRLTRRTVLKAACTVRATVVAGPALAQQPTQQTPRVKGPRVWLDMDQKELDGAYDQSVWAQNAGGSLMPMADQVRRAGADEARVGV